MPLFFYLKKKYAILGIALLNILHINSIFLELAPF